jgi:hypothetical protein
MAGSWTFRWGRRWGRRWDNCRRLRWRFRDAGEGETEMDKGHLTPSISGAVSKVTDFDTAPSYQPA